MKAGHGENRLPIHTGRREEREKAVGRGKEPGMVWLAFLAVVLF